ncbi:D-2-hydroxyacid dehydrogenase [Dongshaea marina]|uniref:D-2-hydroxyacid dehydrogenase n=1 Tax=Dongshaea marina TaxID=2047966 RepID=UPI000D3E1997|nr:D-2-hydroxyacid dehydrogenase [Dongshaea marina]
MTNHILLLLSQDNSQYEYLIGQQSLPDLQILRADDPMDAREKAGQAEIILGDPPEIAKIIDDAPALKWVQSSHAGVDALLQPKMRQDYQLTNVRHIFGPPMSEYVFAQLLGLNRHLSLYREQQRKKRWHPILYSHLHGKTMLLLGTGTIGQHVAATAKHFGMKTLGINQSGRHSDRFDRIYNTEALDKVLPQVDVIINTLPATPKTYHMLGEKQLRLCKPNAILFNVGRGSTIDTQALIEVMNDGHLGAAILDVFEQEPLPSQSPLWSIPNLIITPHISAYSFPEEVTTIFTRNYLHYINDTPLDYQIDFHRGY